jgi:tetratricopeptide (TPR) repeat protein
MKPGLRNWLSSSVWICVFFLFCSLRTPAQQPIQQPSASPAPAQTQPPPSSDLAAQEDQLIKKCNEQLNVKGQFKEAEESAKQALELSQKMGDKKRILVAMLYLGSAYYDQGRRPEALEVFQNTAALARETNNQKGLSRALNNIAGVLGDLGRYEESISYLYQCLDVARTLGDQPMQFTALLNVGQLYIRLGDPDKAEAPLLESLRIGREMKHSELVNNPSKVATEASLRLLGDMEIARERFQPALKYLNQVRESHPDNAQAQIELLDSLAVAHQRLGEYQKASELLQEAITPDCVFDPSLVPETCGRTLGVVKKNRRKSARQEKKQYFSGGLTCTSLHRFCFLKPCALGRLSSSSPKRHLPVDSNGIVARGRVELRDTAVTSMGGYCQN